MLKSTHMNILLTNDDGYNREGLLLLQEALKKYGNVYIVAPFEHQSGASMRFSIDKGFTVRKHGENYYSIDGTPVDCVLLATQILDVKFDLVVSGCNDGPNISYDILYSGTVGAAIEGINHNIPSIAISSDFNHLDIVRKEIDTVLNYILEKNLISKGICLNVNFPLKEFKESKGIKITNVGHKNDEFYYWIVDGKYYTDRHEYFDSKDEDSDVYAIKNGYISISPLSNTLFSKETYIKMKR